MGLLQTFAPDTEAICRGRPCRIVRAISASSVSVIFTDSGEMKVVQVSQLHDPVSEPCRLPKHPDAVSPQDMEIAEKRFQIIKPFLVGKWKYEVLNPVAEDAGVSIRTIQRWIKKYKETGMVSALAPARPKKRTKRLSKEVEAIVADVIEREYLARQKKNVKKVIDKINQVCRAAGLTAPAALTIRRRVNDLNLEEATKRREGKKKARDKFQPVTASFPGADCPLAVVQIDHTPMDIIVVDDVHREPIGRPWLTLAIDVFSRMITGYYLSLDHPSAFSVGMCLRHSILEKNLELAELGIDGSWDLWGKMSSVHADNGKDFRSELIKSACLEHGISLQWRPVKTPHWGGHIERMLGSVLKEIHALPGTTFSNVQERGSYDSEKTAIMTLQELRQWLLQWIVGVYHQRIHSGLDMSPLAKWELGILGDGEKQAGSGIPGVHPYPERLRLDFLPYTERTVQRGGIVWDHIAYYSEEIRHWIGAKKNGASRNFKIRRDPRDISELFFLDPDRNDYITVPYLDKSHPSVSLWEWNAAKKHAQETGQSKLNEEAIFAAWERMGEIAENAAKETKRTRREAQKKRERRKSLDRERTRETSSTGKSPRKGLRVVVNNEAPLAPVERYEIDEDEINKGWEDPPW